jgi:hypothetical protein
MPAGVDRGPFAHGACGQNHGTLPIHIFVEMNGIETAALINM